MGNYIKKTEEQRRIDKGVDKFIKGKTYERLYLCPCCGSDDIHENQTRSRYVSMNYGDINEGCWWETESFSCNDCEEQDMDGYLYQSSYLPPDICVGTEVVISHKNGDAQAGMNGTLQTERVVINSIITAKDDKELVQKEGRLPEPWGHYRAGNPADMSYRRFTAADIVEVLSGEEVNNG
jgi:hypothetical protein